MSETRSLSDAPWPTGRCATGSMRSSVAPRAPSFSLIACTSACISAGWSGPICTSARPGFALRSFATLPTQSGAAESGALCRIAAASATTTLMQFLRPGNEIDGPPRSQSALASAQPHRAGSSFVCGSDCDARRSRERSANGRVRNSRGRCRSRKSRPPRARVRHALDRRSIRELSLRSKHCRARPAPIGASAPPDRAASSASICLASVGEVMVPVRMRNPAPWFAAILSRCVQQRGLQQLPIGRQTMRRYRGGAIRIVEIQQLRLREHVGGAEARRMLRIALHLDRPAHLMLDDNAGGVAIHDVGGAVKVRQSRNDIRRHPHRRSQVSARFAQDRSRRVLPSRRPRPSA